MTYTFDDAVKDYKFRSSIGQLVQGIEISPFVDVPQQEYDRVKFLNNLFYETINKLREEYAPTVEMTKSEQIKLLDYLDMSNLQEFMDTVTYEDDLYATLSFEDITQAWLHPETIKVVDE